ncbi:MAG: hypothetical protein MZV64_52745 [Ignavibacteriales bacterium]|nr:hypothetical protein [Ignavibacteriales bacterium]
MTGDDGFRTGTLGEGSSARLPGRNTCQHYTILEKREDKEAKVFLARLEIPEVAAGLHRMAFIVSDGRSGLSSRIIGNFLSSNREYSRGGGFQWRLKARWSPVCRSKSRVDRGRGSP